MGPGPQRRPPGGYWSVRVPRPDLLEGTGWSMAMATEALEIDGLATYGLATYGLTTVAHSTVALTTGTLD